MDAGCGKLGGWQIKRCLLTGFWIEAHHSVAPSVIGNPQLALLVLDRAPRAHAVASRKVVLDVDDVRGGRIHRSDERLVLRQFLRRGGLWRGFAGPLVES